MITTTARNKLKYWRNNGSSSNSSKVLKTFMFYIGDIGKIITGTTSTPYSKVNVVLVLVVYNYNNSDNVRKKMIGSTL